MKIKSLFALLFALVICSTPLHADTWCGSGLPWKKDQAVPPSGNNALPMSQNEIQHQLKEALLAGKSAEAMKCAQDLNTLATVAKLEAPKKDENGQFNKDSIPFLWDKSMALQTEATWKKDEKDRHNYCEVLRFLAPLMPAKEMASIQSSTVQPGKP